MYIPTRSCVILSFRNSNVVCNDTPYVAWRIELGLVESKHGVSVFLIYSYKIDLIRIRFLKEATYNFLALLQRTMLVCVITFKWICPMLFFIVD
jgi:hypothetical protein